MPWRLPVGLDALLPSCRACNAAALFVWHRHAGPHRRAIRCGAPMRLPLRSTASPCHAPPRRRAMLHRVAVPCSHACSALSVRIVLRGKLAPLRGRASVVPPFRSTGCLRFAPRGHLHSAPRVGSTSLHRCDDARKTADLRHRSPSPGGELQQKCEAMGTVALHPGFPLMRMIFFDKTPLRDPCLWGEVE